MRRLLKKSNCSVGPENLYHIGHSFKVFVPVGRPVPSTVAVGEAGTSHGDKSYTLFK